MPSQREDVRIVACASNSPRIPIVANPPRTIRGSENFQNAWGNSSKPENQWTTAIFSLAGSKKWTIEKSAETKIAAGTAGIVWRTKPRMAPLNKASSISATEIAVRSIGGNRRHGRGSFNSQIWSARRQAPKADIVHAEIRNPPSKWGIRRGFLRRPRFWSRCGPIHRTRGIRSRKAETKTDRLKNRSKSVYSRNLRYLKWEAYCPAQKSQGASVAPSTTVPIR